MNEGDPRPDQVVGQFEAFYRARYGQLVGVVYALTGNRWIAEDLAQEAFLRAHRDWEQVLRAEVPEAWVRRVAINLAMSRFRRLRSEAAARLRLTPQAPSFQRPAAEHDAFWAEVRDLPRRQAEVLVLYYLEELKTSEIAQTLQVAEGTVRALLTQARVRLAPRLVAKGWDHD